MKTKLKSNLIMIFMGMSIGFINGILGAGGGMIAVPLLKKAGLNQKESHANAVAVILPITIISGVFYIINQSVTLNDALIYMPTGLLGAVLGTMLLKKISPLWLKRIFGFLMIYAGVRLLIK